jgi:transcriptional regulator with XRE-family HTH domain
MRDGRGAIVRSMSAPFSAARPSPRPPSPPPGGGVGALLREWRRVRRLSQLDLALLMDVSARHVSRVEGGRAQPSRHMVTRLADALGMPLRERNALLSAAGYAREYPERGLDTPEMTEVRRAIDLIVAHHEPYPAFVMNRRWDVLLASRGAAGIAEYLIGGSRHGNMVLQFCDPDDLRGVVVNWEEVAGDLIRHLHDEIAARPADAEARTLLERALAYPGVPSRWATRDPGGAPPPVLTVEFRKDGRSLRFFSTITTFGTPRDVTLDELRIECAFPADEGTAELCRGLAGRVPLTTDAASAAPSAPPAAPGTAASATPPG